MDTPVDDEGSVLVLAANDVASVVISRSGPWTDATRLQKLLYYVQAWHLAITDEPLFPERIKAWKNGPVVPQVWHERKDQASRCATTQRVEEIPVDDFTSDLIDLVLASYGSMSADELSALTHVEGPWMDARGATPEGTESRESIDLRSMARYYRKSRRLGGQRAADLAAGGIHVRGARAESIDVDEIFASLGAELSEPGENPWGSANIDCVDAFERATTDGVPRRSYADW